MGCSSLSSKFSILSFCNIGIFVTKWLLSYYSYEGVLNAFEGECCFITDHGPCWWFRVWRCASAWYHPQKWQIRQRGWTYLDAWPVCSVRTLLTATDRYTAQNSLRKNGIIRTWRGLMKNGWIKPRKRQECRGTSGTINQDSDPLRFFFHFLWHLSTCFLFSSLSLYIGCSYTAKTQKTQQKT